MYWLYPAADITGNWNSAISSGHGGKQTGMLKTSWPCNCRELIPAKYPNRKKLPARSEEYYYKSSKLFINIFQSQPHKKRHSMTTVASILFSAEQQLQHLLPGCSLKLSISRSAPGKRKTAKRITRSPARTRLPEEEAVFFVEHAAIELDIPVEKLYDPDRKHHLCQARQLIWHVLKKQAGLSTEQISRIFRKSSSSVNTGIISISHKIRREQEWRILHDRLSTSLKIYLNSF